MESKELTLELLHIYQAYCSANDNIDFKERVQRVYEKYRDLSVVLEPELAHALNLLVDLGYNTGLKVNDRTIKEIVEQLKCRVDV